MNQRLFIFISCLLTLLAACTSRENKTELTPDPLVTNRDSTVRPGDNFFRYANGGWFKRNPIPASENSNGLWRMIGDTINAQVLQVCSRAAATESEKGSNKQKIGDFFAAGMDTVNIEEVGLLPLKAELDSIASLRDIPSVLRSIAHLHTLGAGPAFGFYLGQDDKISTKYALFFSQGGLGLGDKDYYFNSDDRTVNIRNEYVKHIHAMLMLIGQEESLAGKNSASIMMLETDLARSSRELEALRDPVKNYNKFPVKRLKSMTPRFDWPMVLGELGVPAADTVIIGQPEFFTSLSVLLRKYSIEEWKAYLTWNLIDTYAAYLNRDIEVQNFKFYSTILNGVTKQRPRWKRVVQQTNGYLGELIGQIYIEEYLPKGTKEKLLEIGNAIRDVYAERIKKLDWMSEETKARAQTKLAAIVMKVGYPDKWKDLSQLEIDRSSYCANVMRANAWRHAYEMAKFGKPVDRTEWGMYPQTYNAYYNPSNNEIAVPACNILVPGFERQMADDAILYGIIGGSTFGHEITHGFDDQGSQYDEKGNLKNWWTEEDRAKFLARTKKIVDQYSAFTVLDSIHVNGDATQGENIADLGGVIMGYEAFKKTKQYQEKQVIGGLTPDERFFLGYAYAWMINTKDESLARQIMTDVHAPVEFRVNGPLANMPEFHKTFGIKPGDAMYRPDSLQIVIW
ncbi:MAG: M13 family metallopeptidase [Cyclobacteriaceae bacterium]|nr:M13 family metallopeptidase [Cyclobacteriaceae bacterium]